MTLEDKVEAVLRDLGWHGSEVKIGGLVPFISSKGHHKFGQLWEALGLRKDPKSDWISFPAGSAYDGTAVEKVGETVLNVLRNRRNDRWRSQPHYEGLTKGELLDSVHQLWTKEVPDKLGKAIELVEDLHKKRLAASPANKLRKSHAILEPRGGEQEKSRESSAISSVSTGAQILADRFFDLCPDLEVGENILASERLMGLFAIATIEIKISNSRRLISVKIADLFEEFINIDFEKLQKKYEIDIEIERLNRQKKPILGGDDLSFIFSAYDLHIDGIGDKDNIYEMINIF